MPSSWVNPFNPYFPAAHPLFANRRRELSFYRDGLAQGPDARGLGPWNVALLGSWGIGKTSLLLQFALLTDEIDPPALSVVVTVTSGMRGLDGLAGDLLARISTALASHLEWPDVLRREFGRWQPAIRLGPVEGARKLAAPAAAGGSLLFGELDRLWRQHLAGKMSGLVILLDEAQQLLALQGAGARYPLVVAGPETLFDAMRDLSEPVTRFFERMSLGSFSLEDTTQVVRGSLEVGRVPLELEDEAIHALWNVAAGHPLFTAFAMRDLVRREADAERLRVLTAADVKAAWPQIASHLAEARFAAEWARCTQPSGNSSCHWRRQARGLWGMGSNRAGRCWRVLSRKGSWSGWPPGYLRRTIRCSRPLFKAWPPHELPTPRRRKITQMTRQVSGIWRTLAAEDPGRRFFQPIDYHWRVRYSSVSAEVVQLVERRLPKPKVAGSRPVFRSKFSAAPVCGAAVLYGRDESALAGIRGAMDMSGREELGGTHHLLVVASSFFMLTGLVVLTSAFRDLRATTLPSWMPWELVLWPTLAFGAMDGSRWLKRMSHGGRWAADWLRLVFHALPALLITLAPVGFFTALVGPASSFALLDFPTAKVMAALWFAASLVGSVEVLP